MGLDILRGGGINGWTWHRKLISQFGNFYVRIILGRSIRDWTGGFNGWNIRKLKLQDINSKGYSFQIEMKCRALRAGSRICEVPIVFDERRYGKSKMSFKIVAEALICVWKL